MATFTDELMALLKVGSNATGGWDSVSSRIQEVFSREVVAYVKPSSPSAVTNTSCVIVSASTGTNDIALVNAAIQLAVTNGTRHIHFPRGTWIFDGLGRETGFAAVTIPSNFRVTGEGEGQSIIRQVGLNTSQLHYNGDGITCFYTADDTHNVVYAWLHFIGENGTPDGRGFTKVLNMQASCITSVLTKSSDITIHNCVFENLWGFSIHDPGSENKRIHALFNKMRYCANGMNINAEGSLQCFNVMEHSEGIESSGAHTLIKGNILYDSLGVAISGGGTGDARYGQVIDSNLIIGSDALGIIVGEGFIRGKVTNNYIQDCVGHAIEVVGSPAFNGPNQYALISGNRVFSPTGAHGIWIADGAGYNMITNNQVECGGYGLLVSGPNNFIYGNMLQGGVGDFSIQNGDASRVRGNKSSNNFLMTGVTYFQGWDPNLQ